MFLTHLNSCTDLRLCRVKVFYKIAFRFAENKLSTFLTVLSRVKVKFADTVIRLEHVPKDSNGGVAVEFRIKK